MDIVNWLLENPWVLNLLIAVICFNWGWRLHERLFIDLLREHPERFERAAKLARAAQSMGDEQLLERLEQFRSKTAYEHLDVECRNDVLYAYSKETGQFLAQGSTMTDVFKVLHSRFPDRKFIGNLNQEDSAK